MEVKKTWKPLVAGILDIVVGAGGLFIVILFIMLIISPRGVLGWLGMEEFLDDLPGVVALLRYILQAGMDKFPTFLHWVFIGTSVLGCALNVLVIVGGVYAIKGKKWGLALAGSIAAIFPQSTVNIPIGILATIFTAMSKDEFET
jgi:hypothetical protein